MEVFLLGWVLTPIENSFLHVRGGVSSGRTERKSVGQVFSTCVEVFLWTGRFGCGFYGFLHVRGGVSWRTLSISRPSAFSPRAWRCFSGAKGLASDFKVFSTCVEVFLLGVYLLL